MSKHLSCCGFDCAECPVYQATINNDEPLKLQVAERYNLDAQKLACTGCRAERGNTFLNGCAMRCCVEKNVLSTCAACKNYPCSTVDKALPEGSIGRVRLNSMQVKQPS
ncbi:MAG: DUF3795 domain-containing protein [Deferribacteraceae bacterium]|jgi:hypothetical protein|nr:DUF3795 domain-containing protein [Deferribacteraceae bacterium]